MASNRPPVRMVNCVCTFSIGLNHLDLCNVVRLIPFCEFNKRKFAAASLRLRHPRSTCLIFSSGNLVVTGCRSESEALLASYRYCALLRQHLGLCMRLQKFRIQNLVAAAKMPWNVDLVAIARKWQTYTSYEPEVFPGLIMRLPNVVLLIFRSGNVVITGAQCRVDVEKIYNEVYNSLLYPHREASALVTNSADYRVTQVHLLSQQHTQEFDWQ